MPMLKQHQAIFDAPPARLLLDGGYPSLALFRQLFLACDTKWARHPLRVSGSPASATPEKTLALVRIRKRLNVSGTE